MSTQSEITAISKILVNSVSPCIVELGGYHGEDSMWMMQVVAEKNPVCIMVEPDPQNIATIKGLGYGGRLIEGAISDHTGHCDFWACYTEEGRGSGSIRRPTGHITEKPWYDFKKMQTEIPCYALDDIFIGHELDHIDVLWVDIQGAERDMIAGGQKALKHTRFLFIEAEERELYEGQALRPQLLKSLPEWVVIAEFEHNLLLRNDAFQPDELVRTPKTLVAKQTGGCPNCHSVAIGIAGGMRRCNQCGQSFV